MDPNRSLTRKQFDEVIRRAAELAASEPDGGESALNEEELFRIAREVGLDERHVRKALVQVRAAPPPGRNPVSVLFGPPVLYASRVVPGRREDIAATIDEFMVAGRLLQAVRRGGSVLQYRPAVDWASQIARAASSTSKKYYVASAKWVEVRLESMEGDRTLVELEVEPGTRDDYLAGGLVGGAAGGVGVGVGLAMAIGLTGGAAALGVGLGIVAGTGVLGGIAWVSGYYHKKRLLQVRAEMEGILDCLEAGESLEPPPSSWRRWVRRHFHGVAKEFLGEADAEGL
jgi:hypothetical protein